MCENVKIGGGGPWEREGHFSGENWTFSRGRVILEENLITRRISLIKLSNITGITVFKLRKYRNRLL